MTNHRTLVGWIGALLLAGTVVAQDERAGHHAPEPASKPAEEHQQHDHGSMPQHKMDPGMQQQQHDEHMKGHEGHTMPGARPSPAADPHAHHGTAAVTDGPWSYKGRKNPEPYTKGRWEMVPTNPRTGMYVTGDRVSPEEHCRMLKEADYLAVDRTTKVACGMTAQATPGAVPATKPKAPIGGDPGHHAGMGHEPHEHWAAPPEAIARPNPVPRTGKSLAMGKKVFDANCVSCHGPNGNGDGPAGRALNPKPTNLPAMHGQHTDGDFAWKIANGRGPMPAWKGVLSEEQIWHVVNYVQSLGAPGSGAAPASHDHSGHKH